MTRYFFDPVGGSDANSGLTRLLPKQSLSAAGGLVVAGNQISFKCGSRAVLASGVTGWVLNNKVGPCTIDYYDDDLSPLKPLFDGMTYLAPTTDDGNWTSLGDGRWTRAFTAEVNRMFVGTSANVLANTIGAPFGYVSTAAAVTSETKWHMLTSSPFTVTMYTGSLTVAPPTYFGGLACVGNNIATVGGIWVSRCSGIHFDSIRGWGGQRQGLAFVSELAAGASNCSTTDCEWHAWGRGGNGFVMTNTTSITTWVDGCSFIRPYAHAHSSVLEDDGDAGRWSAHNGVAGVGRIKNALTEDPIVLGGCRHSYIQWQRDGTTTIYEMENITVRATGTRESYIDAIDAEYGHDFDFNCQGFLIEGIEIRNHVTRSQLGQVGIVRGCFWSSCREALQPGNLNTEQCLWIQNWRSPDYRKVVDILIENNRFKNPWAAAIAISEDPDDEVSPESTFYDDSVRISQNVIEDRTHLETRTYSVDQQVSSAPHTITEFDLTDNIFITPNLSPVRREVTSGGNVSYTVNGYSGASGNLRYSTPLEAGLDDNTLLPLPVAPRSARIGRRR